MPPTDDQKQVIMAITVKLAQLGYEVKWQEPITTGPLVTTYRFLPMSATKVSQIIATAADLTIALRTDQDVLIRRLPGEGVLGVSVPNKERKPVMWRDTLAPCEGYAIPLNMGMDSQGRWFRDDLAKLPHLLCAGSTGSGKSTWMNSLLASLMFWRDSSQVQFAISDTKAIEFPLFDDIPHQYMPRAKDKYTSWEMMDVLFAECQQRLVQFGRYSRKNIAEYNIIAHDVNAEPLPYIVFVIDELASVLAAAKKGEAKIAQAKLGRIVQLSRAAGIHVICGVQRPSVDIVSGDTKNNFPARLAFKVFSAVDSRVVLDTDGAEHLLNMGDMLYLSPNQAGIRRLHAAYATMDDVSQAVEVCKMKYQLQHQAR